MWRNLFILYFVLQRTIERKKKRSKISALESCYANRIYGTFGVEMRAYGQKLVTFVGYACACSKHNVVYIVRRNYNYIHNVDI